MWEHPWVWVCNGTWEKAVQESSCLEWWFWHGLVCFLGLSWELMLDTIWEKFEEFCKPQSNEGRVRFNLLTSFWQGKKSVDEVPPWDCHDTQQGLFRFFLKDEELVSKTIYDSNIVWDKFPTSKVRQLAKKMESSKANARHIKQVGSDPQVAQINLMWHQSTDLPVSKHKNKSFVKPNPPVTRIIQVTDTTYLHTTTIITRKALMPSMYTRTRRDARSVEI